MVEWMIRVRTLVDETGLSVDRAERSLTIVVGKNYG